MERNQEIKFSNKDIEQINAHGLSESVVLECLERFSLGFPPTKIVRAATLGDGIVSMDEEKKEKYAAFFDENVQNLKTAKFVPASGAASRMFKDLYEYAESENETLSDFPQAKKLIDNVYRFAFAEKLDEVLKSQGTSLEECLAKGENKRIIKNILYPEGLDYGRNPKALILFHRYDDSVRTSIEEHLVEAAMYCTDDKAETSLHFTISPEHFEKVEKLLSGVLTHYEKTFGVKYNIKLSVQKSSTDIPAVNLDNTLARDEQDRLIFRPSGHGALLSNLQETSADIIFVKNIDNVEQDYLKESDVQYKKMLGGLLLEVKQKRDELLRKLESGDCSEETFVQIRYFIGSSFGMKLQSEQTFDSSEAFADYVRTMLERPLRVCSMVRNEGQPGGGPFWVESTNGEISLQIVEKAQINLADKTQNDIFQTATHFNPVDIVCCITDHKGNVLPLGQFVDADTGFISEKTQKSSKIKIQERPGLWNGSMARWLTIFVETPITYFNPVKTVNDLLNTTHQPR